MRRGDPLIHLQKDKPPGEFEALLAANAPSLGGAPSDPAAPARLGHHDPEVPETRRSARSLVERLKPCTGREP
jgi:hypothetical protein